MKCINLISVICLLVTLALTAAVPSLAERDTPLTTGIKFCLDQPDCSCANRIFEWCTESAPGVHNANSFGNPSQPHTPDNTLSFNCLCDTYLQEYITALSTCTTCILSALIANPQTDISPPATSGITLWTTISDNFNRYCADTADASSSLSNLIGFGQLQSYNYQAQVLFYNVTLVTGPLSQFGGYLPNDGV